MWMLKLKIHSSLSSATVEHSFKIQCSSEQSLFDTIFMDGNHRRLQCSQSRFVWKFSGICLGAFAECLFLTPWCFMVNSPVLFFGMGSFSWAAYSGTNVLLSILRSRPLKLGSWSSLAFLVVPATKPVCFALIAQRCTDNLVPDSVHVSVTLWTAKFLNLVVMGWINSTGFGISAGFRCNYLSNLCALEISSGTSGKRRIQQNTVLFPNSPWSYDLTKFVLREFFCKPTEWNWQLILSSLRVISSVIYVKVCVAEYVERLFLTFLAWINDAFWMAVYTSSQVAQIFSHVKNNDS